MLAELVESNQHSLSEVTAADDAIGRPLSSIRDERAGLVLGLVHDGRFRLGIREDPVVAAGDSLLLAEPTAAPASAHTAAPASGENRRRAGRNDTGRQLQGEPL